MKHRDQQSSEPEKSPQRIRLELEPEGLPGLKPQVREKLERLAPEEKLAAAAHFDALAAALRRQVKETMTYLPGAVAELRRDRGQR